MIELKTQNALRSFELGESNISELHDDYLEYLSNLPLDSAKKLHKTLSATTLSTSHINNSHFFKFVSLKEAQSLTDYELEEFIAQIGTSLNL